jgi:hypothetical protein
LEKLIRLIEADTMATNPGHKADNPEPAVNLWRWFWVLVFGVVVVTLLAVAAIANKSVGEEVVPGPDWPQCCDHWKAKQVSASKHLIY